MNKGNTGNQTDKYIKVSEVTSKSGHSIYI